jgi:hypothetical protein
MAKRTLAARTLVGLLFVATTCLATLGAAVGLARSGS